jgi:hypothetical protein
MTELIAILAQAEATMRRLTELASGSRNIEARGLIADLELQLAQIETEAANLNRENLELRRQVAGRDPISSGKNSTAFPRPVAAHHEVEQKMRAVSEFYQRVNQERQRMQKAA